MWVSDTIHDIYEPCHSQIDAHDHSTYKIEIKERAQVSTAGQQHGYRTRVASSDLLAQCCEERQGAMDIVDSARHDEAAVAGGHCPGCRYVLCVERVHVVLELGAPPSSISG